MGIGRKLDQPFFQMLTAPRVVQATCLLRREREKSGRILFIPKESNSTTISVAPLKNLCLEALSENPHVISTLEFVPEELRQNLLKCIVDNFKVSNLS